MLKIIRIMKNETVDSGRIWCSFTCFSYGLIFEISSWTTFWYQGGLPQLNNWAVTQAVCIIHTEMASKRHKHASAFLIINTAILETDKDYEDQETGACYVYVCVSSASG